MRSKYRSLILDTRSILKAFWPAFRSRNRGVRTLNMCDCSLSLLIRSQRLLHLLPQSTRHTFYPFRRQSGLRRRKRPSQTMLRRDTLDAVRRVDVLDQSDLVASCGTLAGDDGGVGEKVFPYLGAGLLVFDGLRVGFIFVAEGARGSGKGR